MLSIMGYPVSALRGRNPLRKAPSLSLTGEMIPENSVALQYCFLDCLVLCGSLSVWQVSPQDRGFLFFCSAQPSGWCCPEYVGMRVTRLVLPPLKDGLLKAEVSPAARTALVPVQSAVLMNK